MRDGTPRTKMNDATVQREKAVETKDKYAVGVRFMNPSRIVSSC